LLVNFFFNKFLIKLNSKFFFEFKQKKLMENYHILHPIGEGSFGKVFKGRRKQSG